MASMPALDEVTVIAATDCVPDAAARWPVRVVAADACTLQSLPSRSAYLCGHTDSVRACFGNFEDALLGVVVDGDAGAFATDLAVEVVPRLHSGFSTPGAWEAVVSTVCNRHKETMQHMIFAHAQRNPDKLAVVFEDRQWTYRQFLSLAFSLRCHLRNLEVEPSGGKLAVQMLQSDRTMVVYLALYSGRYEFQLVDSHPDGRAFRLSVCPCQALLCESGATPADEPVKTIFVDELQLDASFALSEISVEGYWDDIAFIEYTSGSTGRPKSVATMQWKMAHWIRWRQFHFPMADSDRVGRNLFFIWYWHIDLCQGGTTVVYPPKFNYDISGLMAYARKNSVSWFDCLTPGLILTLLELEETLPETLTMMISGGEALPLATCRQWLQKWPHCALWNNMATTETAADLSFARITPEMAAMDSLFAPISDGTICWQNVISVVEGELHIRGLNIASGYLPPTVSDRFIVSPDGLQNEYRPGDRAEWRNGYLFIVGRTDSVVKIRGHRVDLAGVEAMLAGCDEVKDVACVAWQENVCSLVVTDNMRAVRQFAEQSFPQANLIVWYEATSLPYTKSGKRDRKESLQMLKNAAPDFRRWIDRGTGKPDDSLPGGAPATEEERRVAAAWEKVLGRPVGREEPFQQAGGHSLLAMKLAKLLGLQPHEVIAFPTVAAMAARLCPSKATLPTPAVERLQPIAGPVPLAVVGMAGRFPGASSTSALWQALEAGKDLLMTLPAGPSFVPRKGVVPDLGLDCNFWGLNPEIAMTMDTAQRSLLEAAYEALEDAGLDPFHVPGRVGVVLCGGSLNHYASDMLGVDSRECFVERPDDYFALECGVDKDYLATQIAFQLNLHGPAETVATACSSSLVAVVRAVQMLKLRLCDYVICGGASFSPDDAIKHVEGMIWAPDGICRPFSQDANGTINSDGCGLVVLTHLDNALQRNQRVYATVLGAATNNDGARKAGFSAPSFEGQVEVIQQAHADAGISGDDVDYIEAHGTGTRLGDPLEAAALTEALNTSHPVLMGSVKGNLGHMNTAAGIPGFMKSTLMLYHQRLVPSLYCESPNQLIDWDKTPLRLAQGAARDWSGKVAGVSSFGIGGTNAHVVLGAPPPCAQPKPTRSIHLFAASAKTSEAVNDLQNNLASVALDIDANRERAEATLLARPCFEHRAFALRPQDLPTSKIVSSRRPAVLLFPGQGAPYKDMGAALEAEGLLSRDWSGVAPVDVVRASLAVAKALEEQGLVIEAVVGHSVGEWAAAAFAGAVSREDAVRLADLRGQLMATMEPGAMISVRASAQQVADLLHDSVELACVNGVENVVLAGPPQAMTEMQMELDRRKLPWKRIQANQAFHTAAVDSILPQYEQALQSVSFSAGRLPMLCNVTGGWHGPEATTAEYWARHLRQPVRFADNLRNLSERFPKCIIVEVGPSTLAGVVAREAKALSADWEVVPTMKERDEVETYVRSLGMLWAHANLRPSFPGGPFANMTLPSYCFQRTAFSAKAKAKKKLHAPEQVVKHKHQGVVYETIYERIQPSCLEPGEAAVLIDGPQELPKGLEDHAVLTAPDRAIVAATRSGRLIFVGTSDASPDCDDITQEKLVQDVVELLKSLTKSKAELEIFFVLKANVRYAGLRGLLRSASKELSELRLRLLILEGQATVVLPVLPGEYVLRSDGAYAAQLRPAKPPPLLETPHKFERALVTGGLRGLGVKVAEWLVTSKRVASLVLAGRRAPQGDALETIQKLQEMLPVQICLCDVAKWVDVQTLPGNCDLVVHAAGNVKDGFLLHATEEEIQQVLRPKVRGGVHLKQRFPEARFFGFSSTSGLFGAAGQATYAAANVFLDAIMPTIQWGGWGEVGMSIDLDLKPIPGERFLSLSLGLDCLGRVLDAPCRLQPLAALDVDWSDYRQDPDLFTPEDPLLAHVDAAPAAASILGCKTTEIDDVVLSWQLVVGPRGSRFRGSSPAWDFCQQHVVNRGPIFPGTAYVALALEAVNEFGMSEATLTDVAFLRPLDLTGPRLLTTTLLAGSSSGVHAGKSGTLRFTSRALREDGASEILHCTCNFMPAPQHHEPPMQVSEGQVVKTGELYERFAAAGFHYGPAFRGVSMEVSAASGTAQCKLLAPAASAFKVHPASLDTSMHPVALLNPLGLGGVPYKIRALSFWSSKPAASARLHVVGAETQVQLLDAADKVLCSMAGLELAVLDAPPTLSLQCRSWRPTLTKARGAWLAVGDAARELNLTNVVCNEEEPHTAAFMAVRAQSLEDVRQCADEAQRLTARVPCWVFAVDSPYAEAAVAAAVEVGAQGIRGTVEDLQRVSEGLGIDTPHVQAKGGSLLSPELEPVPAAVQTIASPSEPFLVTTDPSQGARGAKCLRSGRRAPEAHEVELQTSLWALNFRDVLVAVGAIPADVAGQSLGLGGECYGEVVRVGSDVSGVAVGERVIGVPPDGMGSFATIDARWVAPAPATMSPEEAVSGTMVYATAWLGLHWMARISEGERVLIHSAAGGVGLAAVNLCLRAGCEVFGTASTPEKRSLLLSMGVSAAFDSRSVEEFSQGVRDATGGEGVDVVLNSLSGAAIPASLKLLAPFGRFIEIGKRDQYEDNPMGLAPFLGGLTYATAHVDVLMLRHPKRCRKLLEEVWAVLPGLPKLPATTFKISELSEALEYFSKGVHIGKVLVSISENVPVSAARPTKVSGPLGDPVTQALQVALNAKPGLGGVVCVPNLQALTSVEELRGAQVVLTASSAVAALAACMCPDALCVELPRWEAIKSLDEWLGLQGNFVATEEESAGNLQEWLMEVISEMAGNIDMDQTFEAVGLDSLALISLARRLTSKVGKSVSVVDLYDYPSPKKLLNALTGGPQQQVQLPKVVCLHGFRSNKEIMSLKCAPFVSAVGAVDWIFVNAPRPSTGPADPGVPVDMQTFEWWGQKDGPYETAWLAPHFDGLKETLPLVNDLAPTGVVGFSQGGAIAALVPCQWCVLFSAVVPPDLEQQSKPSFHSWDPEEEYVSQCKEVSSYFSNKQVHTHGEGHNIPQHSSIVKAFATFVSEQLQKT